MKEGDPLPYHSLMTLSWPGPCPPTPSLDSVRKVEGDWRMFLKLQRLLSVTLSSVPVPHFHVSFSPLFPGCITILILQRRQRLRGWVTIQGPTARRQQRQIPAPSSYIWSYGLFTTTREITAESTISSVSAPRLLAHPKLPSFHSPSSSSDVNSDQISAFFAQVNCYLKEMWVQFNCHHCSLNIPNAKKCQSPAGGGKKIQTTVLLGRSRLQWVVLQGLTVFSKQRLIVVLPSFSSFHEPGGFSVVIRILLRGRGCSVGNFKDWSIIVDLQGGINFCSTAKWNSTISLYQHFLWGVTSSNWRSSSRSCHLIFLS